jgi:protein-L-isoaspartate(D-aspartate) O-methyltransferase
VKFLFILLVVISTGCGSQNKPSMDFIREREQMVKYQIKSRGISDTRVLNAMIKVPRHLFVPESHTGEAYDDMPLPIGLDQTISQPYIVAFMTEQLRLKATDQRDRVTRQPSLQRSVIQYIRLIFLNYWSARQKKHWFSSVIRTLWSDTVTDIRDGRNMPRLMPLL